MIQIDRVSKLQGLLNAHADLNNDAQAGEAYLKDNVLWVESKHAVTGQAVHTEWGGVRRKRLGIEYGKFTP